MGRCEVGAVRAIANCGELMRTRATSSDCEPSLAFRERTRVVHSVGLHEAGWGEGAASDSPPFVGYQERPDRQRCLEVALEAVGNTVVGGAAPPPYGKPDGD